MLSDFDALENIRNLCDQHSKISTKKPVLPDLDCYIICKTLDLNLTASKNSINCI